MRATGGGGGIGKLGIAANGVWHRPAKIIGISRQLEAGSINGENGGGVAAKASMKMHLAASAWRQHRHQRRVAKIGESGENINGGNRNGAGGMAAWHHQQRLAAAAKKAAAKWRGGSVSKWQRWHRQLEKISGIGMA